MKFVEIWCDEKSCDEKYKNFNDKRHQKSSYAKRYQNLSFDERYQNFERYWISE